MNITASLLNMMGGRIEIESTPQEGSVFTLYIPQKKGTRVITKNDEPLAGTGRLANMRGAKKASSNVLNIPVKPVSDTVTVKQTESTGSELKLRYGEKYQAPDAAIIIVDDTKSNLFVASSLLKRTKIKVDTASSGAEFLKKAEKTKYDVILMDYWMPNMTGSEAVEALRGGDGINSKTTVIMMTGESDHNAVAALKEKGLSLFINKPIDPIRYEAMIAAILPEEKVHYQ